jgi:purine-cytosine permease-like protein
MEELAVSVLSYGLWPSLTLAIVALWVAAALDITRHTRRGTSTNARLVCMTTLVSVVAVIAVAGISAVFAAQWTEAVSGESSGEI